MKNHYPSWIYKEPNLSVQGSMYLSVVSLVDPDNGGVLVKKILVLPSSKRVAKTVSSMKRVLIRERKAALDDYWEPKGSK